MTHWASGRGRHRTRRLSFVSVFSLQLDFIEANRLWPKGCPAYSAPVVVYRA
jgi:hypothetical protein